MIINNGALAASVIAMHTATNMAMLAKQDVKDWEITFSNGYCGCDETEEFTGTYDDAVDLATDYLGSYAETYAHAAFGWDAEYTDEEYEEYLENCCYEINEVKND